MSIAQIITPIVQPKIEKKLEFDFDSNVEYETLRSFLKPPSNLPDSYGLTDQPSVNTEGKDGKHTKSPKKKVCGLCLNMFLIIQVDDAVIVKKEELSQGTIYRLLYVGREP